MKKVVVALGSNLGEKSLYFSQFLQKLRGNNEIILKNTSFLYSSPPALFEDQPDFLNAAIEIETTLDAPELLKKLQLLELSKSTLVRYGPRELDLDLILYGDEKFSTPTLNVPHPRLQDRAFVLKPLVDLGYGGYNVQGLDSTVNALLEKLSPAKDEARRCVEFHGNKAGISCWTDLEYRSFMMGILNVTPDSFSDGGRFFDGNKKQLPEVSSAVDEALKLIDSGADIVDIGGESTRPFADAVSRESEIERVVPVLDGILAKNPEAVCSVDTLKPSVAETALEHGVAMVNDVRGEYFRSTEKPDLMYEAVARSGRSICIMHSMGDAQTMNSLTTTYENDDCVEHVKHWLQKELDILVTKYHVPKWNIWIDPGVGFAKTGAQNLQILSRLSEFAQIHPQLLLGASRKRFINDLVGVDMRESGTAATTSLGVQSGAKIFRVHDVATNRSAATVANAICSKGFNSNR